MSHSLSSQVHSTTAASASNVSPLHHSGSTTVKVAPRSVLVNWSESSRLNEGDEFPFDIFEAIALKAALDNPLGGYDKTDITVNFDNGHQHRCRVDLGCGGNECGFADHCFRVLEHALSLEKSEPSHWYFTHAQGRELLALLKTYQLNRHTVALSRSQVLARTRLAKAQKEAEEQAKTEQRKAAHQQRVEREKAKKEVKYQGRKPDLDLHEKIYKLRVGNQMNINETAKMIGVSARTVVRVVNKMKAEREEG